MIFQLYSMLDRADPRAVSKWNEFVNVLKTKASIMRDRFDGIDGKESHGMRILRYILSRVDFDYLFRHKCSIDTYFNYVKDVEESLTSSFDSMRQGVHYDKFIRKNDTTKIPEILLPGIVVNPVVSLPIGANYTQWKSILPVKPVYIDSEELCLNVGGYNAFSYRKIKPQIAIFNIDVISLVYKYCSYCKKPDNTYELKDDRSFLHSEIFLPMQEEYLHSWCLTMMNKILIEPDSRNLGELMNIHSSEGQSVMGSGKAFNAMYNEINLCQTHKIKLEDLFNTKWLYNQSIIERLNIHQNEMRLPLRRRYRKFELLRDLQFFVLLGNLLKHFKDYAVGIKINMKMNELLRQFNNERVIEELPNDIKLYVQNLMDTILNVDIPEAS